jgi:hypothetical protein
MRTPTIISTTWWYQYGEKEGVLASAWIHVVSLAEGIWRRLHERRGGSPTDTEVGGWARHKLCLGVMMMMTAAFKSLNSKNSSLQLFLT